MDKGYISFIESLGGLDGPGLRTVFFLQGCPARCLYCHNPETQSLQGGDLYTVQDVLLLVEKYRAYYGTNGGVTFSGGEPLVQRDFLLSCLKALREQKVHTTLDTSGTMFDAEIFDNVDLVMLDIKHTDPNKYKSIVDCDISMDTTHRCIEYFEQKGIKFWVRQVIVPEYNDDQANIQALKKLGKCALKIELLPYHALGKNKYEKIGKPYPDYLQEPTPELMARLNAWLKE
ncbi:MAG: radical SAM protein [Firmicutes bacterium]|nr:radical SAM protein [Bacillota bacterium]